MRLVETAMCVAAFGGAVVAVPVIHADNGAAASAKPVAFTAAEAHSAQARSKRLAVAAAVALGPEGGYFDGGADARAEGVRAGRAIPLPPGGNFNGIQWDAVEGLSGRDIAFTLQYNAACQWLRAYADGRARDLASAVLAEVPSWSSIQPTESAAVWAARTHAVRAGETSDMEECLASAAQERAYAVSRGLEASL
jgi:hypothetical protein